MKQSPAVLAARTGKWAEIMAKWHITFSGRTPSRPRSVRWELVSFRGRNGGESRGIVDMIAIRKNHTLDDGVVRRGDLLDIVLIQVKGGGAGKPTSTDAIRMRAVMRRHHAKAVVYAHWRRNEGIDWYRLARTGASNPWPPLVDWRSVFK